MVREMGGHRSCAARECGADLYNGDLMRGFRLCQACRRRVASELLALPRTYQACEQVLELRRNNAAARTRISGGRPEGIRLNEAAVELRSLMVSVLRSWADVVTDHRPGPGPASLEIGSVARFLNANLDWLVAHPAAGDFVREVGVLVEAADKVLNPDGGRRVELGRCVESDCERTIYASVRPGSEGPVHQVGCDGGHTWPIHQWLQLGLRLDRTQPAHSAHS